MSTPRRKTNVKRDRRGRYAGSVKSGTPPPHFPNLTRSYRSGRRMLRKAQRWLRAYKRRRNALTRVAPPQRPVQGSPRPASPVMADVYRQTHPAPYRPKPLALERPVKAVRDKHSQPVPQTVTMHGRDYTFTTEGGQDRETCGIVGSLWYDGDEGRQWMAYVSEGGARGRRHIMGADIMTNYDANPAAYEAEAAALATLKVAR